MKTIKINKDKEYLIVVVAPREKGDAYRTIMAGVIKAIDIVESNAVSAVEKDNDGNWLPRVAKPNFVFLHNGVTSGALNYVIEAVNKIGPLIAGRGRYVSKRKQDMDIPLDGKYAESRWFDRAMLLEPDLILLLDDGHYGMVGYAERKAQQQGVPIHRVKIPYAPVSNKL